MSSESEHSATSELRDDQSMMNNGFTPIPEVKWEDIGGLSEVKCQMDVSLIARFKKPDYYELLGLDHHTGILLYGPPGCGKTMIVQALVNKVNEVGDGINYLHVEGPEVLQGGATTLTDIFTLARMHPPCILFLDNMDVYASGEGNLIVTRLKHELEIVNNNKDKVHVLGATNRIDLVDSSLCAKFDLQLKFPLPNPDERRMILEALARKKLDHCSFNFSDLSKACENFSGANLNLLMDEVVMAAQHDNSSTITVEHINQAMLKTHPIVAENNAKEIVRRGLTPIPGVKWEDVGGLSETKGKLEISFIQRFKQPNLYQSLELDHTGILLHGPPGCGKTMLVQALVNKVGDGMNYIHVKGPELLKENIADEVNALKSILKRARMNPPCILFFDNMDAYTRKENKIVSLLQCELGHDLSKDKVYVFGATNRIDLVDSRLLTYPRFGLQLKLSLPNSDERQMILEALARKKLDHSHLNFSDISKACENFSGADLNSLMDKAAMAAHVNSSTITVEHFNDAMLKTHPSVIEKSESAGYMEGHEGV